MDAQQEPNVVRHGPRVTAGVAVVVSALSLLAAGCGGGSGSPGVASVASSSTPATTTQSGQGAGGSAGGAAPGAPRGAFSVVVNAGNAELAAKFSACMRKNGVPDFPDPNSQGVIRFGSRTGIDPNSPAFKSARSTCQKLLPNGGQPTPAQQAAARQHLLAFSACMRAHGIKDFPDPSSGGIRLRAGPGSDLDPSNPQFQAAQKACQADLPGKLGPAGKPGGGG